MRIFDVKDYETAFNFLLQSLKETRAAVRENMDDSDDEVQFAMADGYMSCCTAIIVLAEEMQRRLVKNGDKDND